jgi:hypothetical protein
MDAVRSARRWAIVYVATGTLLLISAAAGVAGIGPFAS